MLLQKLRLQRGFLMMSMVLIIMLGAMTYMLSEAGYLFAGISKRLHGTQAKLDSVAEQLTYYTMANRRLPCPANPALPIDDAQAGFPNADPAGSAVSDCTFDVGIVPWKALSLSAADVTDEWGRMISYRVYDGTIGLTQAQGMSMIDCDTSNDTDYGTVTPETPPGANGQCASDTHTLESSFLTYAFDGTNAQTKGLTGTDFGTAVDKIAFVLVSHGPSGLGGYLSSGDRMDLPQATAADYPNVLAPSVSFAKAQKSADTIAAGSNTHFDDLLVYRSIADLAKDARVAARDWPEPPIPGFDETTTADMDQAGTDHFLTQNLTGTREFQPQSDGNEVGFGNDTSGGNAYAACMWWPQPIQIYSSLNSFRRALMLYFEVALHGTDAGAGLTVGFLPTDTTSGAFSILNSTCGDLSNSTRLGWEGGTMPRPRFGVEFDARTDVARSDPLLLAVTGASWAANVITFATDKTHGLNPGDSVIVQNAVPSGYNNTYTVQTTPTATSFTVLRTGSPGTWSSGGSIFTPGSLVTAASWSSGTTTYTLAGNHGLAVGSTVIVTLANPSGYRGTYTVTGVPSANSFTVARSSNPGTWTSDGRVRHAVNHVGLIRNGVTHDGTLAASCPTTANTNDGDCYTASTTRWLMDGLTKYHRVRVDVEARSASCSNTAPYLRYWLMPNALCTPLSIVSPTAWSSDDGGKVVYRTSANHRLRVGDKATISGASPASYNGTFTVTAVTADTFTVAMASDPGTWSSGGSVTSRRDLTVQLLSWATGTVTLTTATDHGLQVGDTFVLEGVSPSAYNGTYRIATVPATNQLTFSVVTNPGIWVVGGTLTHTTPPQDCTDIANLKSRYLLEGGPSGGVYLAGCATTATPSPSDAFDSLYFGFTASNRVSNNALNFLLRNLNSNMLNLP